MRVLCCEVFRVLCERGLTTLAFGLSQVGTGNHGLCRMDETKSRTNWSKKSPQATLIPLRIHSSRGMSGHGSQEVEYGLPVLWLQHALSRLSRRARRSLDDLPCTSGRDFDAMCTLQFRALKTLRWWIVVVVGPPASLKVGQPRGRGRWLGA